MGLDTSENHETSKISTGYEKKTNLQSKIENNRKANTKHRLETLKAKKDKGINRKDKKEEGTGRY